MTALADRRRRNTWVAAVLALVAVLVVGAITVVGASTLANSRAGRDAGAGRLPQVRVPATPAALVAVTDDDGTLTSVAVLVVAPDGAGGSIVAVPSTADSSLNLGDDRFPLAETLEVDGVQAFVLEVQAMTALSFDVVEVVTAERLSEIISPLGPIDVDLPVDVPAVATDDPADVDAPDDVVPGDNVAGDDGVPGDSDVDGAAAVAWPAGPTSLTPDETAALLATPNPDGPQAALDPARSAVWSALAEQVGAGLGTAEPVPDGVDVPSTASLDEHIDRLFAGRVGFRELTVEVPDADRNPRGVDVVVVDRAEVLLVFAQIAPGRVAAPNESLTFRIEAAFSEEDLAPFGLNNADVVRDVIHRLLFVQANVVSVATDGGDGAPDVSQAAVADANLLDRVDDGWTELLGEIDVAQAGYQIPGVDATIVLGRSYLELRRVEEATGVTVPGGLREPTELGPTDDEPTELGPTDDEPDDRDDADDDGDDGLDGEAGGASDDGMDGGR